MASNARAIRLYRRVGFVVEGRRREALRVDGRYVDELYAGLLLSPTLTVGVGRAEEVWG